MLESSAKQTCELVLKKKDGAFFDVQLESVAIKGDGRKVVHTVLTNITERKRAQEAVRKSEEWLMQFFDSIPDYCYLTSPEGKIINANRAALEVLDYNRDELLSHPVEIIYAPQSQQKGACYLTDG